MRAAKRRTIATLLGLGLLALGGSPASGEIIQAGNIDLRVDGQVKPKRLPPGKRAPVTLSMSAQIATMDGTPAPGLRRAVVDFDEQGAIYRRGLGSCPVARIEDAGAALARKRCRRALIGGGTFGARLTPPDGLAFEVEGPISIFNGAAPGRRPKVLIHAAAPGGVGAAVAPARFSRAPGSIYGKRVDIRIPERLGSYRAQLTSLRMRVSRRWRHRGQRRSFVTARCTAGNFVFRGELLFDDGTRAQGSLIRGCRRKRR